MKLTVVTAVFNAIKSGNRENLIRCVRSVDALKTEHEHLIYDGGSTDGTVVLLRELERKCGKCLNVGTGECLNDREKVGQESRSTKDGSNSGSSAREGTRTTVGGESGALIERALPSTLNPQPSTDSSAIHHSSFIIHHSSLRIVSEPDTGIYNALNKGVRDARGEWFYVLGCDDEIVDGENLAAAINLGEKQNASIVAAPVYVDRQLTRCKGANPLLLFTGCAYPHQGVLMRTSLIREYGQFNERYPISADFDLILRACFGGAKVVLAKGAYTFYSTDGLSSDYERCTTDAAHVLMGVLKMTEANARVLLKRNVVPFRYILPFLISKSSTVRMSARYHFLRRLADMFGLLNKEGALRRRTNGERSGR